MTRLFGPCNRSEKTMANLELAAAFGAADAAKEQDLRGYYPMAARVLAEEVRRLKAERDSLAREAQRQAGKIERLRERVFELEADPKSGDVIPLAEPRCGDLRRSAERCITAWTVVRGGVWDPNGLMDEHMAALRKALGPNVGGNRQ